MSSETGLICWQLRRESYAETMAHIQLKEILHIMTSSLFGRRKKKKETFIDRKIFTSEFG
ncbi:hypothetical protein B296_00011114 [Ensete ventricosum]|uniref:Uncharacterized protein n=1 Tax=Ensete ventricosum TaxID=4639 RepID=A0A427AZG3_ENSVE|nr:hypothetical protein B296_00011114 [Ensete ventricosum]